MSDDSQIFKILYPTSEYVNTSINTTQVNFLNTKETEENSSSNGIGKLNKTASLYELISEEFVKVQK